MKDEWEIFRSLNLLFAATQQLDAVVFAGDAHEHGINHQFHFVMYDEPLTEVM